MYPLDLLVNVIHPSQVKIAFSAHMGMLPRSPASAFAWAWRWQHVQHVQHVWWCWIIGQAWANHSNLNLACACATMLVGSTGGVDRLLHTINLTHEIYNAELHWPHASTVETWLTVLDDTWCGRLAMAERIDPETVSHVQKTSNKWDREGRAENFADVTIYAITTVAMPS